MPFSSKDQLPHPKYRPDIDGLRAVGVLAVVAFHAFPTWMKGGFIGVDIFFVISGYLISTILFEGLEKGTFTFGEFYARRIRRIFPALIMVLVTCFAFGWFSLLADEYKQLGKHIAAGAAFVANLFYWQESGYFDNAAETKPLLHLWSLGIEEQFYIVWPLLLWLAWKGRFNLFTLTVLVALISFVLNIRGLSDDKVKIFFLPQTRFWELLCGSLLAWLSLYKEGAYATIRAKTDRWLATAIYREKPADAGKTLSNVVSWLGLLLLLYGFWRIDKNLAFPGKWALIPVAGTVLIIAAGAKAWVNRAILSHKIAVWFGLISFPLYLWHWPLLSFARIVEGEMPSRNIRIAAVLISVVLAWLTYRLVERPIRCGEHGKVKISALIFVMTLVGYVGYSCYSHDGLPFRAFNQQFLTYSASIQVPSRSKECFDIPNAYKKSEGWFCDLGMPEAPIAYFLYGDSHALSLLPAFERFAIDNKLRVQFAGTSGCPSLLGIQSMRGEDGIEKHNCKELNERIFHHVEKLGIKTVILANRWTYYTESISRPNEFNPIAKEEKSKIDKSSSTTDLIWAMNNTVQRYSAIGVKVIFIADNPQQTYEPKDILRKGSGIESKYLKMSVSLDEHQKNQKAVNEALRDTGAKVINFDDLLCLNDICPLVANEKFLYSDDDHLSVAGSFFISSALFDRLKH
ncbi:MAG: acyltransferase family protein [Fluviibacter sp.]